MNTTQVLRMEQSLNLKGELELVGAKNAALVIMASLILTKGKSILKNIPASDDVYQMIELLKGLGAKVDFIKEKNSLDVDTSKLDTFEVSPNIMKKMRASILVMGPLLNRFGEARVAIPGGCLIGTRPIDYHINNLQKMGVKFEEKGDFINAHVKKLKATKLVLEYPSVGATENLIMTASLAQGITKIVNAALEPEVLDLITVLQKMGANIKILPPGTIEVKGVVELFPIEHEIIFDRLEAGTLVIAAAITKGELYLPQAQPQYMETFLAKIEEMGHLVDIKNGIRFKAIKNPKAVSFRTAPYPGFPTDLQAPMMALQVLANGTSIIQETVFENRLLHVRELQNMGAQITIEGNKAIVKGVDELYGTNVIATDIRASSSLVLAGLAAKGKTEMTGIHHFTRGYQDLDKKLITLGAKISHIF